KSWRHAPAAALSAAAGALVASVVFHLLSGFLFPRSSAWDPVGGSVVIRLLATLLVTLLVAVALARGAPRRLPPPAEPRVAHCLGPPGTPVRSRTGMGREEEESPPGWKPPRPRAVPGPRRAGRRSPQPVSSGWRSLWDSRGVTSTWCSWSSRSRSGA